MLTFFVILVLRYTTLLYYVIQRSRRTSYNTFWIIVYNNPSSSIPIQFPGLYIYHMIYP